MENQIDQLIAWSKTLKVLYVEDDIALREEVSLFLCDIFTQVDLATNGEEGLEKLSHNHYDLVITDIRMPIMDGIEMIEQINERYPSLPILVTSAHNESEYLMKLINLNVDNFITKPLQSEQIFRVLHRIVKRIHTEQERDHYKDELENTNQKLKKIAHQQSQSIDLKDSLLRAYQEALDKATIVSLTDKNGIIIDVNENFCKETGYTKEEIIGQKYDILYHPSMSKEIYKDIWSCLLAKKTWQGLIINQTRSLKPLYNYKTIVPVLDANGEFIKYISIAQDLTELYKHNEQTSKENLELAMNVKEEELLKHVPFASAFLSNDLQFENYNALFAKLVNNHVNETLLGRLTAQKLHLAELINFEEMDYFNSIEDIKSRWPFDGDITFKGVVHSMEYMLEVLVKISQYAPERYIICIVKQEDFELCCQVQER